MRLTVPYSNIVDIDVSELSKEINNLDQLKWDDWKLRQTRFPPHKRTNSIPFIWNNWDQKTKSMKIEHMNQDSRLWELIIPILQNLRKKYEGTIVNCLFARLPSKEKIFPHKDTGIHLLLINRIHVPIKTNSDVKFFIDGKKYVFPPGRCFELSNEKQHAVFNMSDEDRVHLIIDILPSYFRAFLNSSDS